MTTTKKKSPRRKKTKLAGYLEATVAEQIRDLAYWDRRPVGAIIEEAAAMLIAKREREIGAPLPRRPRTSRRLPAGRPTKSSETK